MTTAATGETPSFGICPLCGAPDASELESVPVADLECEYLRQLGVDITNEFPSDLAVLAYRLCGQCGLKFFDPPVAGSSGFYAALSDSPEYYWDHRWEFLESRSIVADAHTVIDVGCGDGHFLSMITNPVRIGLEFNPDAVERARRRGLDVRCGDLSGIPSASAQAVTLFQVLEHVPDPVELLADATRVLGAGGHLVIAVPNNDGYMGRSIQDPLNAAPHHPLGWGKTPLEYVEKRFNLKLIRLAEEPVGAGHLFGYRKALVTRFISWFLPGPLPRWRLTPRTVLVRKAANAITLLSMRLKPRPGHSRAAGHSILAVYRKTEP